MKLASNGISIEVEDSASVDPSHRLRPAVLLIMGLGMQLVAWPEPLVQDLLDAGYRVVRLDNRDAGLSTSMDDLGVPRMGWGLLRLRLGLRVRAPYTLHDMALDALGVLLALDIARAHVVGVSMGGMIAQRMAIAAPERVASLTSIMSSSGARGLPGPRRAVLQLMMRRPRGRSEAAAVEHFVRLFQAIGSPGYPTAPELLRERIAASVQRSLRPAGTARQMFAVASDITRAAQLGRIQCPTLVLHGHEDPLLPFACGEDTAQRISGARLVGFAGMGHDLPAGLLDALAQEMLAHFANAQARGGAVTGAAAPATTVSNRTQRT